jgi:branched-chain amino acid transport system permease protein
MDVVDVLVTGVLLGGIYALVSIGLTLIFGVIQVVNFAQGEFVMLGMYGAFYANQWWGLDPYVSILVVGPATFLLGLVIQRLIIQPLLDEPVMQIFATFGLVILLQNSVLASTEGVPRTTRTSYSTSVIDAGFATLSVPRVVVLVFAVGVAVALVVFLRRTMLGTAIRAVAHDRMAARLMGIDVERVYMFTFGLGVALAAIAGAMLAPIYTVTPAIGFNFILPAFAVVILGGLGSIPGALLGGLVVGVVESFSGFYLDPSLKQAIWFALFIAVLVIRPSGLLGRAEAVAAR